MSGSWRFLEESGSGKSLRDQATTGVHYLETREVGNNLGLRQVKHLWHQTGAHPLWQADARLRAQVSAWGIRSPRAGSETRMLGAKPGVTKEDDLHTLSWRQSHRRRA